MAKIDPRFKFWHVPRIWAADTTVFIIGGGPSLEGVDLSPLQDRRCIGVNCSYMRWPWIDFTFFGDKKFLDWHMEQYREQFLTYPGLVVTNCDNLANLKTPKFIRVLKRVDNGLTDKRDSCGWNANSGAGAINLAFLLGSKRIVLIGFDMKAGEGKKLNWHDYHIRKDKKLQYTRFRHRFQFVKLAAERLGIEIINANPDSALEHFPKIPLEKAFEL